MHISLLFLSSFVFISIFDIQVVVSAPGHVVTSMAPQLIQQQAAIGLAIHQQHQHQQQQHHQQSLLPGKDQPPPQQSQPPPKRRFREELPEEKPEEGLLGYQVGYSIMIISNLIFLFCYHYHHNKPQNKDSRAFFLQKKKLLVLQCQTLGPKTVEPDVK